MGDPKRQCKTCPWRAGATTDAIPRYDRAKHEALRDTIAEPGSMRGLGGARQMMACHHSADGAEHPCVGWVHHQIGAGNNIGLRLAVLVDPRLQGLQVDGPQRASFEETFAAGPRKRGRRG